VPGCPPKCIKNWPPGENFPISPLKYEPARKQIITMWGWFSAMVSTFSPPTVHLLYSHIMFS